MITPALANQDVWNKKTGMGLLFGVDYKHHFYGSKIVASEEIRYPQMVGIGVGLGVSHLSKKAFMDDHTETVSNYKDKDGDICDAILSYKGVKEKVALTYLDIPIYLEIGRPSQVKLSGYFDVGLKASILVSGKFTGEGTYSASGFYKTIGGVPTNVEIHDVDVLDYYSNKNGYEDPQYSLSRFVLWGTVSGGISIPFSSLEKNKVSSCILRIGARADYSILPVSKKISEPVFKGDETNYRIGQSNMLGANGSRIFLFGFDVKLIYCF
jgi:hypothetical protein